jgi:small subunit ribosomal protein S20
LLKKNKSAIKKARQGEKNRLRNAHVKSNMKTNIKKVLLAMQGKDKDGLQQTLKEAVTCIDKAASKGVIHKNNAARRVSRLSKKVGQSLS